MISYLAMEFSGFQVVVLLCLLSLSNAGPVQYQGNGENEGAANVHFNKFTNSKTKRQSSQMNTTVLDNHVYYTSTYYPPGTDANALWVDGITNSGGEEIDVTEGDLSAEHRYFMPHKLPFSFPFYGHIIDTIAVTTGGFLYTSEYYHPYIHLTQYIAPLQADFNPSLNETARVFISSTDDRFTVLWDGVHNHDHVDAGPFTFQVSLFRDGTIHFVYRNIPLPLTSISNENHPVEVGVSDSFYLDDEFPGNVVVRSIWEYSRVQLNSTQDLSFSAYVLTPVENCVTASSCGECSSLSQSSVFQCQWCPDLNRCSDGVDRYRQEWVEGGCDDSGTTACSLGAAATAGISVASVVIVLIVLIVIAIIAVVIIGYKRPTSKLGLFLIEHRPKARSLNKSSASYNVDTGKTELKEDLGV